MDLKKASILLALISIAVGQNRAQTRATTDDPKFTTDGKLVFPRNYREWVFLSSGLGMTYEAERSGNREQNPQFSNVFVIRSAYNSFIEQGKWPDRTMFILEIRSSESRGSINKGGRFQGGLSAIVAEVKDQKRFPSTWAFFDFGEQRSAVAPLSTTAGCYSCHAKNGAVDNTFVQFYPTLLPIAKEKGTLRSAGE